MQVVHDMFSICFTRLWHTILAQTYPHDLTPPFLCPHPSSSPVSTSTSNSASSHHRPSPSAAFIKYASRSKLGCSGSEITTHPQTTGKSHTILVSLIHKKYNNTCFKTYERQERFQAHSPPSLSAFSFRLNSLRAWSISSKRRFFARSEASCCWRARMLAWWVMP